MVHIEHGIGRYMGLQTIENGGITTEFLVLSYASEAKRLYGVLDKRLGEVEYLSGSYSIADMATWPWIARYEWHGIDFPSYPDLLRWYKAIAARPAVQKGFDVPAIGAKIPLPSS